MHTHINFFFITFEIIFNLETSKTHLSPLYFNGELYNNIKKFFVLRQEKLFAYCVAA